MGKQEWVFIIPDKKDSLEARMKVRPQHLGELQKHIESGACAVGGASLDEPIREGVAAKINGSLLILEADTEAEARAIVEGDVYYREGVWDVEKIQMFPFRSAVRQAMS